MNITRFVDGVVSDIRYALRTLRLNPAFSVTAVLTLGLGIAATTAMFSVVDGVIIKPLPYPDSDALVTIGVSAVFGGERTPDFPLAPRMFASRAKNGGSFQAFGLFSSQDATVTGMDLPEHTTAVQVTRGVLTALDVRPVLGRWFSPTDDRPGTPETVILSYGYWQRRFGGDPGVVGRAIIVDSTPRDIVGVMPASFSIAETPADLILPLRFDPDDLPRGYCCRGVARLAPGATLAQANASVARMVQSWMQQEHRGALDALQLGPAVRPLKQDVVGDIGRMLWLLLGGIGVLLLIACANVANLLLVRAEGRGQELAIRTALGASGCEIARAMLAESLTLGLAGGVAGLAVAYAAVRILVAYGPANLPRLNEITIDPRVFAFALAASIASGLLFGLIPLVHVLGPRRAGRAAFVQDASRWASAGRHQRRAQSALVVTQMAMALVLTISAGLMMRTFENIRHVNPGFSEPETIQAVRITLAETDVPEPERVPRVQRQILDRLAAIPGVRSAGFINALPMEPFASAIVAVEGKDYGPTGIPPGRAIKFMSPGTLRTLGTPLVAGRDFTWGEIYNQRNVALVSESFARESWRSVDAAIGKRIRVGTSSTWQQVIGVVANVYDDGADKKAPAIVYWPARLQDFVAGTILPRSVNFVLRSERTGTESLLRDIQQAVNQTMPGLPVFEVRTLRDVYDHSMSRTSFSLVMLGLAGSMALLLGIIGIYGVLAYAVAQERRDVGIRLALGAGPGAVKGMFVYRGLVLSGVGIAIGVLAAAAVTRVMSSLLFGVKAVDAATFAVASGVLVMAALAASYIPASRAAAIDPAETLRTS